MFNCCVGTDWRQKERETLSSRQLSCLLGVSSLAPTPFGKSQVKVNLERKRKSLSGQGVV